MITTDQQQRQPSPLLIRLSDDCDSVRRPGHSPSPPLVVRVPRTRKTEERALRSKTLSKAFHLVRRLAFHCFFCSVCLCLALRTLSPPRTLLFFLSCLPSCPSLSSPLFVFVCVRWSGVLIGKKKPKRTIGIHAY